MDAMTELSLRGNCDKYTPQRGNDLGTEAKVRTTACRRVANYTLTNSHVPWSVDH